MVLGRLIADSSFDINTPVDADYDPDQNCFAGPSLNRILFYFIVNIFWKKVSYLFFLKQLYISCILLKSL